MLALGLMYGVVLAGLYAVQRRMIFLPGTQRPSAAAAGVPGLRELIVPATDGVPLLAWYRPPQPGQPTLLYLHGNGGTLDHRAPRARRFGKTGWGLLFLEWRGYGGNPGHPSETGFRHDAEGAMAELARLGVPAAQVMVYGESIGTGIAVPVAAGHGVAALILESPYTSIAAIAAARMPWVPVDWLLRDRFDSLSRIAAVQAPVLMLQGAQDTVVPPAMGQALFDAAPEPKQLWTAALGRHEDLMQHGAGEAVLAFVAARVPGVGR